MRLRPGIAVAVAALALCAAAYAPVRKFRFIQDDHPIVQFNPVVRRGDAVEIFTTDYWAGVGGGDVSLYRPVTLLSFALERGADGRVDPGRAHVTNVLLHALASTLLYLVARRLRAGRIGATAAALLFAVHPIHVSAVAPLTGRAEILALAGSLAAVLCQSAAGPWPRGAGVVHRPRPLTARVAAWSAGGLLFLALGSKETALVTPLLLVVLELVGRPRATARGLVERAPTLAPSVLAVVAHLALRAVAVGSLLPVQSPPVSDNPLVALHGIPSLATRLSLVGRSAVQLAFPARLSADYSGPVIPVQSTLAAPTPLLGVGAVALLVGLAATSVGRRSGGLVAFSAWVQLGSHLVSGNLIVLAGVIYAERLLYFPSAGFCLLLGAALDSLCLPVPGRPGTRRARPRVAAAILAALVAAGLARTHHECGHWRDEDTLFAATLRSAPRSPRAHFTLAKIRLRQGRHDEALRYLDQTLALWPDFSSAWYERGLLLARRGEGREAVAAFQRAVEINPEHAQAQLNLGLALHQLGRIREAESRLRKVLVRFPELTPARAALAELWMETGRYDDAATAYRRAVRDGRTDLAGALERAERLAATH